MSKATTKAAIRIMQLRAVTPKAPPCFASRDSWLEYVEAADSAHKEHETPGTGPVLVEPGPIAFNPDFDFCGDCSREYRQDKVRARQCRPRWLHELAQVRATVAPDEEGKCAA